MTRGDISDSIRRLHSDELWNTSLEVYEPTVSYTTGEGFDVSYLSSPNATYEARVEIGAPEAEKERGGTSVEVDATARLRDDTGQQWLGWGDEGEASTEVVDVEDSTRYEVQDVVEKHDGLVMLELVEV